MRDTTLRPLAALVLLVSLVLVAMGLVLAMHFEATPRALADAAKGQAVGVPAAAAAAAALLALVGARRPWSAAVLGLAAVLCTTAIVLYAVK